MEASGHYYTVYYISLAVGFRDEFAQQHAFFTQMPDQVSMLDAKDLEMSYAIGCKIAPVTAMPGDTLGALYAQNEIDKICLPVNKWRILVEHTLHALTGKNAKYEQDRTRQLVLQTRSDDFLRLGFLLHRFGDTYAHTDLDHPDRLYFADPAFPFGKAGHGHWKHGTEPDEPWGKRRRQLMRAYLRDLHGIFMMLSLEAASSQKRQNAIVGIEEVIQDFAEAEKAVDYLIQRRQNDCMGINPKRKQNIKSCFSLDEGLQREYIWTLRKRIRDRTGVEFVEYSPESNELMSWHRFRMLYMTRYRQLRYYDEEVVKRELDKLSKEVLTVPN